MKDIDELLMTFFAAAVSVSPLAQLMGLASPPDLLRLVWIVQTLIAPAL